MFCWVPQPQYFHSYILKWLDIIYVCLYEMRNQKITRAQVRVRVIRSLPWWLRCSHGRKGGEAGSRPSSTCMTMPSTHWNSLTLGETGKIPRYVLYPYYWMLSILFRITLASYLSKWCLALPWVEPYSKIAPSIYRNKW